MSKDLSIILSSRLTNQKVNPEELTNMINSLHENIQKLKLKITIPNELVIKTSEMLDKLNEQKSQTSKLIALAYPNLQDISEELAANLYSPRLIFSTDYNKFDFKSYKEMFFNMLDRLNKNYSRSETIAGVNKDDLNKIIGSLFSKMQTYIDSKFDDLERKNNKANTNNIIIGAVIAILINLLTGYIFYFITLNQSNNDQIPSLNINNDFLAEYYAMTEENLTLIGDLEQRLEDRS